VSSALLHLSLKVYFSKHCQHLKSNYPRRPPSREQREHFSISLWPLVSVLSEKFEHHSLYQSERVKLSGRRNLEKQRNKQSSVASQWQLEARFVNLSAEHENLE
jgi:hypothetical protein